jgi:hypothetical protein
MQWGLPIWLSQSLQLPSTHRRFLKKSAFLNRIRPALTLEMQKLLIAGAALGFGILLTASGVSVRRYYLTIAFPLGIPFLCFPCATRDSNGAKTFRHHLGLSTLYIY